MIERTAQCDFLVAGGGLSGICAAIQAARQGLRVILAEKEMLLGGTAGPNMGVSATASLITNPYYNEMGLIEEIEERINARGARMVPTIVNYNISPEVDAVLAEMLEEAGVTICRKHLVLSCEKRGNRISSVTLLNLENLDRLRVDTPGTLIDCTGEAILAQLAGADIAMGRESRAETGERSAPEKPDEIVSAASLTALVVDTGVNCPFLPPKGTPPWNPDKPSSRFDPGQKVHFLWQVDEGGENEYNHPSYSPQTLYLHLMRRIFSQWNYLKNELYPEELRTHQLIWISPVLGRRESRRILGDYLLTQTNIESCREFPDAIAFGGSFLDEHLPSFDGGYEVRYYSRPLPYDIPYRCIYSRNVENLFSGSRAVGVSHLAFTSVRLMRTGCGLAQAAGVAAALCKKYGCTPREIGEKHIAELRQLLLGYGAFLPGAKLEQHEDLAPLAEIRADSEASMEGQDHPQGIWKNAKEGIKALLFQYPDHLEHFSVYLRNTGSTDVCVTARAAVEKTQAQEFWQAPRTWTDPVTGEFHEEAGTVAPEGTDEIRSVKGCRNYFIRRDALTEKWILAGTQKMVPGGFEGYMRFDVSCGELPILTRTIWRQALALSVQGEIEVLTAPPPVDTAEGWMEGKQNPASMPVIRTRPEIVPGAGSHVVDGYTHREGQSRLHAWVSSQPLPQRLTLLWQGKKEISQVILWFDITERLWRDMYISRLQPAAARLAKKFRLEIRESDDSWRTIYESKNNIRRYCVMNLEQRAITRALRVTVEETWGGGPARINEICVFAERMF